MLKVGDKAPEFSLLNHDGQTIRLVDFAGKKVVLYFYPKDDTPGCTKEACSFRDVYDDILVKGAVVIGISPDPLDSHEKFREKYGLPFYLASDTDHHITETYGAWGEKKKLDTTYMGVIRSTYIIDELGFIMKVFPHVNPDHHAEEILKSL